MTDAATCVSDVTPTYFLLAMLVFSLPSQGSAQQALQLQMPPIGLLPGKLCHRMCSSSPLCGRHVLDEE